MADKYTPNKAPNGNTYLRDWWNKVVETNFSTIFQVFSKHIVGNGDRHTADMVDFDDSSTVEVKINTEIADRENSDKELEGLIDTEATKRTEGDSLLDEKINFEMDERITGDHLLENLINSLITTEATERKENDDLKANMTDVLTKDNTTAYSPTNSYHPATKKYVDDIAMNSGAGDMLRAVYDMNGSGVVDDAEKLGGVEAEKYALQTQVQEKVNEIHDILEQDGIIATVKADEVIPSNATKLLMIGSATEVRTAYETDTSVVMNQTITNDDGGTFTLYIGDDVPDKCKGQAIWNIAIDGETDDTYAVFKVDTLSQLNTPPELTEVSPDGTAIGTDDWTGTGFICTATDTKYAITSANVFGGLLGFNRFCLRFADTSGNKWKNWSPWLDVDGVAYEFFYSPARKLYEALIPETTKTAEEIVSSIRWERAEPDIVRYGKVSNMFGSTTTANDDGTETITYTMHTEEGSLRDSYGNYVDADTQVGLAFFSGEITLPTENISQNIFAKLYLSIDTNCDGSFKAQDVTAIGRKVKGAAAFTVETIDNFA